MYDPPVMLSFLIGIPLLALCVALLLQSLALRLFPKWGLLDFPERYGLARVAIPYPLGIVSVCVFVLFFALLSPQSMKEWSLIGAIILLGIFTFMDDRKPLPPLFRLFVQIVVALIIFLGGARIYSLTSPLPSLTGAPMIELNRFIITVPVFGALPLLSALFTILWLGLTINALNWFDGIPGQVSTLSTIGFVTIGLLSLSVRVQQPFLALLAFVLAGISAASLVVTFPPPKAILGDSGAMFFGLMIGVLTIYSGGKVATAFLVLGVPLIDFVLVIGRRILKGKSILHGNTHDEHLHHRLLLKGWSPFQVIALTAAIGTLFGLTALFLNTFEKFLAAGLLFVLMGLLSFYSRPQRKR